MSVALRFSAAPVSGPVVHLVFGAAEAQAPLSITIDLGSPTVTVTALADAVTVSGRTAATWREAVGQSSPASAPWAALQSTGLTTTAAWQPSAPADRRAESPWSPGVLLQRSIADQWRSGAMLANTPAWFWRQAAVVPPRPADASWRSGIFEGVRFALPWATGSQRMRVVSTVVKVATFLPHLDVTSWSDGGRRHRYNREPWRDGARRTSYGIPWQPGPTAEPPGHVCYTPSGVLRFREAASVNGDLLFRCGDTNQPGEGTVVVPVRRTYMVLNNVSLRRVTGDIELPALSMALSLDHASWTYGFSAGLPASAMPYLEPEADGSPALLEATINGQSFLLLAESRSRTRTFGRGDFSLRGRGRNAVLDAPYAPVMQFVSTASRTVQQLMQHVLSWNGSSLGWDVEFGITDWLVPGGTWAVEGSFMSALNDIAGAAGAYLQPHPVDDELRLLPLYPTAPWDWSEVTPDFVLPASLMVQEGVEWLSKAAYNNVVVAGTTGSGVVGNITRVGTAGDLSAPMVTHSLMTHVDAVRQRGIAALGDTGKQAIVTLRLPVLSETGIIMPGNFVSYVDGSTTRFGLTRSVDVQVADGQVWQSITLETHV
jgi:hypothetical protein